MLAIKRNLVFSTNYIVCLRKETQFLWTKLGVEIYGFFISRIVNEAATENIHTDLPRTDLN